MFKKLFIVSILFIMLGINLSYSSAHNNPDERPGWTNSAKVKKVVVTATGGINIQLDPDLEGCNSQSGYGGNFASIYPGQPGINFMLSNLLSAKATGKPVQLYLYDADCKVVEMIHHD